jgi:hypothetical protein
LFPSYLGLPLGNFLLLSCSIPSLGFSLHSFLKHVHTTLFCYLLVCLKNCLILNSLWFYHLFWSFLLHLLYINTVLISIFIFISNHYCLMDKLYRMPTVVLKIIIMELNIQQQHTI